MDINGLDWGDGPRVLCSGEVSSSSFSVPERAAPHSCVKLLWIWMSGAFSTMRRAGVDFGELITTGVDVATAVGHLSNLRNRAACAPVRDSNCCLQHIVFPVERTTRCPSVAPVAVSSRMVCREDDPVSLKFLPDFHAPSVICGVQHHYFVEACVLAPSYFVPRLHLGVGDVCYRLSTIRVADSLCSLS